MLRRKQVVVREAQVDDEILRVDFRISGATPFAKWVNPSELGDDAVTSEPGDKCGAKLLVELHEIGRIAPRTTEIVRGARLDEARPSRQRVERNQQQGIEHSPCR
ncbi:MAG: hypothetical protein JRE45_14825 [Deltaproteobacteria bacterium]|nr:hypothetical protein [Deltaproteobacteria bacterium]